MAHLTESTVEDAALAWLQGIGWRIAHGPDIAPDMSGELLPDGRSRRLQGRQLRMCLLAQDNVVGGGSQMPSARTCSVMP
ncbi:MAG: hypothetical protein NNA20_01140 [Nitrospira sp.]|nr:hypothetical protein [Nitrospira sp.]